MPQFYMRKDGSKTCDRSVTRHGYHTRTGIWKGACGVESH
jgi:hypothetical protein